MKAEFVFRRMMMMVLDCDDLNWFVGRYLLLFPMDISGGC